MRAHRSDDELAEAFNVPVWEVAARRRELQTVTRLAPGVRVVVRRGEAGDGRGGVCGRPAAIEQLSAAGGYAVTPAGPPRTGWAAAPD